jgi:hypothetical protein
VNRFSPIEKNFFIPCNPAIHGRNEKKRNWLVISWMSDNLANSTKDQFRRLLLPVPHFGWIPKAGNAIPKKLHPKEWIHEVAHQKDRSQKFSQGGGIGQPGFSETGFPRY